MSWDDVKLFLALARSRKLASVGATLAVDTSTVSRRLASLETRVAVRLFERTRDGLVPTGAGERLLPLAEETEASVARFFEQVHCSEKSVEGAVRITAPPGVVELLIMPVASELARRHPKLRLEVDSSQTIASLRRREADVAVRLARPEGEGLLVRRVGKSQSAVFASKSLARQLGRLASFDHAPWVAWDAQHAQLAAARWVEAHVSVAPVVRASALLAQIAAVESSIGVGLLPTLLAERRGLVRVKLSRSLVASTSFPSDDVYLVCEAAVRNVPRIHAVWAFLLEVLLRTAKESPLGSDIRNRRTTPAKSRTRAHAGRRPVR